MLPIAPEIHVAVRCDCPAVTATASNRPDWDINERGEQRGLKIRLDVSVTEPSIVSVPPRVHALPTESHRVVEPAGELNVAYSGIAIALHRSSRRRTAAVVLM